MKIMLCGGGSGGHITPILAIANEVKLLDPSVELSYVGEHNGKFGGILDDDKLFDKKFIVYAGKFRRYHKQSWRERIFDYRTNLLNLRDTFYVSLGIIQSTILLIKYKPDVIFLKGGYVGLPIGLAANLLKIPYVTHDSDAMASLTNSIVGKYAVINATGFPAEYYKYNKSKIRYVGVPVMNNYSIITDEIRNKLKQKLGISTDSKMIFITGGSNGADEINKAFVSIYNRILNTKMNIYVVHQVGKGKAGVYGDVPIDANRLMVCEFLNYLYEYSGAADIIIARAGATAFAEFALQNKPVIFIPNPHLTGGHQIRNGQEIESTKSGIVIPEVELLKSPDILYENIKKLLNDSSLSTSLSYNIGKQAKPDAAKDIAKILLEIK
jgi:UDP-N-acetylglucosamine--N-acetylmuramyl-(pentapeptide) pyrophosphoryl-undecaprenol N-acetylglucosamine transferase